MCKTMTTSIPSAWKAMKVVPVGCIVSCLPSCSLHIASRWVPNSPGRAAYVRRCKISVWHDQLGQAASVRSSPPSTEAVVSWISVCPRQDGLFPSEVRMTQTTRFLWERRSCLGWRGRVQGWIGTQSFECKFDCGTLGSRCWCLSKSDWTLDTWITGLGRGSIEPLPLQVNRTYRDVMSYQPEQDYFVPN